MAKKQANKQQERQQRPIPQTTLEGVNELKDADLEQVQGGFAAVEHRSLGYQVVNIRPVIIR